MLELTLRVESACRARHDPMTVDLHGLTLSHSLKIVEEAVNSWWANARDGKLSPSFTYFPTSLELCSSLSPSMSVLV